MSRRPLIVGNSQRLLLTEDGEEIDDHDVVMRLNNAPTVGFERWVGSKTTHRVMNAIWSGRYYNDAVGSTVVMDVLPLEANVTVLSSRSPDNDFNRLKSSLSKRRPDVIATKLSNEFVNLAGDYLRRVRVDLERLRGVPYSGKGSPSSGFLSVFFLLQLCRQVDVYGVATEPGGEEGSAQGIISYTTYIHNCLLYTSPSPRDATLSRMPSSA